MQTQAALQIQSWYRSMMTQYRFQKFLVSYVSAMKIQSVWRGYQVRKRYRQDIEIAFLKRKIKKQDEVIHDLSTKMEAVMKRLEMQ